MSATEDCELHDLVKQTLEKTGSLSKIRVSTFSFRIKWKLFRTSVSYYRFKCYLQAELRAGIFMALEENGCFQVHEFEFHCRKYRLYFDENNYFNVTGN